MYFVPERPVAITMTDCRSMSGPFISVRSTGPLFPSQVMVNGSFARITYSSFVKVTDAWASVASNSVMFNMLLLLAVAVLCGDDLPHNCGEQKLAATIVVLRVVVANSGKEKDQKFKLNRPCGKEEIAQVEERWGNCFVVKEEKRLT